MKAISLWQPWAQLWVLQEKLYETRSWKTSYRGAIAIHAAQRFEALERMACRHTPFCEALGKHGYSENTLHRGCIVGVANLVEIYRTEAVVAKISSSERLFGNFRPFRFAWKLDSVLQLIDPLPMRGQQGIWNLGSDVVAEIGQRLGSSKIVRYKEE